MSKGNIVETAGVTVAKVSRNKGCQLVGNRRWSHVSHTSTHLTLLFSCIHNTEEKVSHRAKFFSFLVFANICQIQYLEEEFHICVAKSVHLQSKHAGSL